MSPRPRGVEEIDAALESLAIVTSLGDKGREEYDRSQALRLALAMCWVSVGSQLKQFARVLRISTPVPDLSGPVRMRDKLAYQQLSDLDADILWNTSVHDTQPLIVLLTGLQQSL